MRSAPTLPDSSSAAAAKSRSAASSDAGSPARACRSQADRVKSLCWQAGPVLAQPLSKQVQGVSEQHWPAMLAKADSQGRVG